MRPRSTMLSEAAKKKAAAASKPATPARGAGEVRIVCDLGHAPALAGLGLPVAAFALPAARPMGWRPLHGVGPWPPELPPPARG